MLECRRDISIRRQQDKMMKTSEMMTNTVPGRLVISAFCQVTFCQLVCIYGGTRFLERKPSTGKGEVIWVSYR